MLHRFFLLSLFTVSLIFWHSESYFIWTIELLNWSNLLMITNIWNCIWAVHMRLMQQQSVCQCPTVRNFTSEISRTFTPKSPPPPHHSYTPLIYLPYSPSSTLPTVYGRQHRNVQYCYCYCWSTHLSTALAFSIVSYDSLSECLDFECCFEC